MTPSVAKLPAHSIQLELFQCATLSIVKGEGARDLLRILKSVGVEFLSIGQRRPEPKPESLIKPDGDIMVPIGLAHDLLVPCASTPKDQSEGTGTFQYIHSYRNVCISQWQRDDPNNVNNIAMGQTMFCRMLYPQLRPQYGWIDESGENAPGIRSIRKQELKFIFWANIFGPPWVEKFGRDFLQKAPGWKKEELDDGGILYVVTERYTDWYNNRPKEVLDYFKKKAPEVKLYRSSGVG